MCSIRPAMKLYVGHCVLLVLGSMGLLANWALIV